MEEVIVNEKKYSIQQVSTLLSYLHSFYEQGMSIGRAYDDIAHTINKGSYHNPLYARKVLDGAKESRDVELMQINERIFIKLRDFFEDTSR